MPRYFFTQQATAPNTISVKNLTHLQNSVIFTYNTTSDDPTVAKEDKQSHHLRFFEQIDEDTGELISTPIWALNTTPIIHHSTNYPSTADHVHQMTTASDESDARKFSINQQHQPRPTLNSKPALTRDVLMYQSSTLLLNFPNQNVQTHHGPRISHNHFHHLPGPTSTPHCDDESAQFLPPHHLNRNLNRNYDNHHLHAHFHSPADPFAPPDSFYTYADSTSNGSEYAQYGRQTDQDNHGFSGSFGHLCGDSFPTFFPHPSSEEEGNDHDKDIPSTSGMFYDDDHDRFRRDQILSSNHAHHRPVNRYTHESAEEYVDPMQDEINRFTKQKLGKSRGLIDSLVEHQRQLDAERRISNKRNQPSQAGDFERFEGIEFENDPNHSSMMQPGSIQESYEQTRLLQAQLYQRLNEARNGGNHELWFEDEFYDGTGDGFDKFEDFSAKLKDFQQSQNQHHRSVVRDEYLDEIQRRNQDDYQQQLQRLGFGGLEKLYEMHKLTATKKESQINNTNQWGGMTKREAAVVKKESKDLVGGLVVKRVSTTSKEVNTTDKQNKNQNSAPLKKQTKTTTTVKDISTEPPNDTNNRKKLGVEYLAKKESELRLKEIRGMKGIGQLQQQQSSQITTSDLMVENVSTQRETIPLSSLDSKRKSMNDHEDDGGGGGGADHNPFAVQKRALKQTAATTATQPVNEINISSKTTLTPPLQKPMTPNFVSPFKPQSGSFSSSNTSNSSLSALKIPFSSFSSNSSRYSSSPAKTQSLPLANQTDPNHPTTPTKPPHPNDQQLDDQSLLPPTKHAKESSSSDILHTPLATPQKTSTSSFPPHFSHTPPKRTINVISHLPGSLTHQNQVLTPQKSPQCATEHGYQHTDAESRLSPSKSKKPSLLSSPIFKKHINRSPSKRHAAQLHDKLLFTPTKDKDGRNDRKQHHPLGSSTPPFAPQTPTCNSLIVNSDQSPTHHTPASSHHSFETPTSRRTPTTTLNSLPSRFHPISPPHNSHSQPHNAHRFSPTSPQKHNPGSPHRSQSQLLREHSQRTSSAARLFDIEIHHFSLSQSAHSRPHPQSTPATPSKHNTNSQNRDGTPQKAHQHEQKGTLTFHHAHFSPKRSDSNVSMGRVGQLEFEDVPGMVSERTMDASPVKQTFVKTTTTPVKSPLLSRPSATIPSRLVSLSSPSSKHGKGAQSMDSLKFSNRLSSSSPLTNKTDDEHAKSTPRPDTQLPQSQLSKFVLDDGDREPIQLPKVSFSSAFSSEDDTGRTQVRSIPASSPNPHSISSNSSQSTLHPALNPSLLQERQEQEEKSHGSPTRVLNTSSSSPSSFQNSPTTHPRPHTQRQSNRKTTASTPFSPSFLDSHSTSRIQPISMEPSGLNLSSSACVDNNDAFEFNDDSVFDDALPVQKAGRNKRDGDFEKMIADFDNFDSVVDFAHFPAKPATRSDYFGTNQLPQDQDKTDDFIDLDAVLEDIADFETTPIADEPHIFDGSERSAHKHSQQIEADLDLGFDEMDTSDLLSSLKALNAPLSTFKPSEAKPILPSIYSPQKAIAAAPHDYIPSASPLKPNIHSPRKATPADGKYPRHDDTGDNNDYGSGDLLQAQDLPTLGKLTTPTKQKNAKSKLTSTNLNQTLSLNDLVQESEQMANNHPHQTQEFSATASQTADSRIKSGLGSKPTLESQMVKVNQHLHSKVWQNSKSDVDIQKSDKPDRKSSSKRDGSKKDKSDKSGRKARREEEKLVAKQLKADLKREKSQFASKIASIVDDTVSTSALTLTSLSRLQTNTQLMQKHHGSLTQARNALNSSIPRQPSLQPHSSENYVSKSKEIHHNQFMSKEERRQRDVLEGRNEPTFAPVAGNRYRTTAELVKRPKRIHGVEYQDFDAMGGEGGKNVHSHSNHNESGVLIDYSRQNVILDSSHNYNTDYTQRSDSQQPNGRKNRKGHAFGDPSLRFHDQLSSFNSGGLGSEIFDYSDRISELNSDNSISTGYPRHTSISSANSLNSTLSSQQFQNSLSSSQPRSSRQSHRGSRHSMVESARGHQFVNFNVANAAQIVPNFNPLLPARDQVINHVLRRQQQIQEHLPMTEEEQNQDLLSPHNNNHSFSRQFSNQQSSQISSRPNQYSQTQNQSSQINYQSQRRRASLNSHNSLPKPISRTGLGVGSARTSLALDQFTSSIISKHNSKLDKKTTKSSSSSTTSNSLSATLTNSVLVSYGNGKGSETKHNQVGIKVHKTSTISSSSRKHRSKKSADNDNDNDDDDDAMMWEGMAEDYGNFSDQQLHSSLDIKHRIPLKGGVDTPLRYKSSSLKDQSQRISRVSTEEDKLDFDNPVFESQISEEPKVTRKLDTSIQYHDEPSLLVKKAKK